MKTVVEVKALFNCSLERAFKTPLLGDATQFLVGYGPFPPVVKFTDDGTWGKTGGTRMPHAAKNRVSAGGAIGVDEIFDRIENEYWKWGIVEFKQWSMGFHAFIGEMFFHKNEDQSVNVRWIYSLHSKSLLAYPFHWLIGKLFWKGQMKRAIQKMKWYAESNAMFLYS